MAYGIAVAVGAVALAAGVAVPASATSSNHYKQTNWVSDQAGHAMIRDRNLVNAWGLSFGPKTPLWVSDNGTDVTTLYQGGNGMMPPSIVPLVVKIPDGAPTGQVFNPTHDFFVHSGTQKAAALFIFASENGDIDGWSPTVGATGMGKSTTAEHAAGVKDAVYKGLAMAHTSMGNMLYAANFHAGTIDVFDHSFKLVHMPGAFVDHKIPMGFAPFNIQNLNGRLYVTYAKQDADAHDDVAGVGNGFVDIYDTGGHLVKRLASHGTLNSPWGLALTPSHWGAFNSALLVGNFGDGKINAYNPMTGAFLGQLHRTNGRTLAIDGLWGLKFGNGVAGTPSTLLFSAGPGGESHGLLGAITHSR